MKIFNTHKFLFTLNYEGNIKGHEVIFIDRDNKEKKITLDKIEIGTSTVSCKLFDTYGNRYMVPFIRIREIYLEGELVWDSKDVDLSDSKIIKGYD